MKRFFPIMLLLFAATFLSAQDLGDHRSAQFATHGTDFWFTMPRFIGGMSDQHRMICIVAEHNCDVTIANERLDYSHTFHVESHYTISSSLDETNFFEFPENVSYYVDTLVPDGRPISQQPGAQPQNYAMHVTSTDTIALYILHFVTGSNTAVNILPTEMLRDEYVVQSYPVWRNTGPCFTNIVATENNTVVDIILSCEDWLGRPAQDTITVTLQRGQMYHLQSFNPTCDNTTSIPDHSFTQRLVNVNTCISDLSGTRIVARDCKRIAVFEGVTRGTVPGRNSDSELLFDQAIPVRFAGKEFIVPNLAKTYLSYDNYIRFTGLVDNTSINIINDSRTSDRMRTITVDAYETNWFKMDTNEGPFYITTNQPVIAKEYTTSDGGPSILPLLPTQWWNSNPLHHHTLHWLDNNQNRYHGFYETYVFARRQDVPYMRMDGHDLSPYFRNIGGTSYSYAHLGDHQSNFNSVGTHDISCSRTGYFIACTITGHFNWSYQGMWLHSHIQPGATYMMVNNTHVNTIPSDTLWCMYDPINFRAWAERPADSIIWDFGDGNVERYAYDDGQNLNHTYAEPGDYAASRIIKWRDESTEDCLAGKSAFTRTPDTMAVTLRIRGHQDSTIQVRLCEGSYYFRGVEYDHTDTFSFTTYWTHTGCDTLWTIDLITCPHCSFHNDTVGISDLPHSFHGVSFNSEVLEYPVYLPINDTCDSIIYYTLVVMNHWGEPPLDSTFILVPNIFTPNLATNNRFKIVANKFILEAQVTIYDRQGMQVVEFDGLTGDWDGTKEGKPLRQGVYIYYIRYRDTEVKGWKTLKGTVTLVR